jgi:hypothetical protein
MALSGAEKQRRYRKRHFGVGGTRKRLHCEIGLAAASALRRLAHHYDCSMTKIIEMLAQRGERKLLGTLSASRRRAYLVAKPRRRQSERRARSSKALAKRRSRSL